MRVSQRKAFEYFMKSFSCRLRAAIDANKFVCVFFRRCWCLFLCYICLLFWARRQGDQFTREFIARICLEQTHTQIRLIVTRLGAKYGSCMRWRRQQVIICKMWIHVLRRYSECVIARRECHRCVLASRSFSRFFLSSLCRTFWKQPIILYDNKVLVFCALPLCSPVALNTNHVCVYSLLHYYYYCYRRNTSR